MFDIFDVDGDGVITKHEMKSVVKDLMIILEEYNNNANALEIFQQMDQNSDDKIDRSEFVSSLMSNNTFGQDLAAKCSQLFSRHIDRSSKGRISSWVVTILSINQFYVFMLFADLWWRELDSPSQGSFVRLPVLIRLSSPEAWQWSYWGPLVTWKIINPTIIIMPLHYMLAWWQNQKVISHPSPCIVGILYHSSLTLQKILKWKLSHYYIKSHNVPTTDCDATFLAPIMLQICYFLQHKKYAGNMSKCPLSAEIFARRVGVVRTTQMTNSQVCFCHSLQYIMSPLTIDDWRKPSNKQSWSLPLPPNV